MSEKSIEDRISKLEDDKQRELDKVKEKYKEQQDAIAAELKSEIARLRAELRSKEKALEKFTGKTKTRSATSGEQGLTDLILAEYADGHPHKNIEIIEAVTEKHGSDKYSISSIIGGLKKRKFLEFISHGVHKITTNGKDRVNERIPPE